MPRPIERGLISNPYGPNASFPQRLAATVSGWPGYPGVHGQGARGVPPVAFYGGWFDAYYAPPPSVTVVLPVAVQPPIVVSQTYVAETAKPVLREYSSEGSVRVYEVKPAPAAEPSAAASTPIVLLATQDGSVFAARAWWVEDEMLHFVTSSHELRKVKLAQVDRALSERLNRERGVQLALPAVK